MKATEFIFESRNQPYNLIDDDVDQITNDFIKHYEDDPLSVFMQAKASYLYAVERAKDFSNKAYDLYRSHGDMSREEFQNTVMKYFGKHLRNNGFPQHASKDWGEAEYQLRDELMNSGQQDVAEDIDYQRHLKLINAHMKKMGYRRIGGGRDAQVYAKQKGNIIKILIPQDEKTVRSAEIPFLEFYKYCQANQKNPHLPKFVKIQGQDYADFYIDGERFVQIAQERLSDIPAPSEYDDMLFDMINSVEDNTPLEQRYPGYELFYKTLKSVAQRGRALGFENDFIKSDDDFNIMLRGKTLVITDPWLDHSLNEGVTENFADGRNPGRRGLSRRVGIPKKATLGQLEKIARSSTGERRRMAQWQLNMRRGRNKKK